MVRDWIKFSAYLFIILGTVILAISSIILLISVLGAGIAAGLLTMMWATSGSFLVLFGGIAYVLISIDERLEAMAPARTEVAPDAAQPSRLPAG